MNQENLESAKSKSPLLSASTNSSAVQNFGFDIQRSNSIRQDGEYCLNQNMDCSLSGSPFDQDMSRQSSKVTKNHSQNQFQPDIMYLMNNMSEEASNTSNPMQDASFLENVNVYPDCQYNTQPTNLSSHQAHKESQPCHSPTYNNAMLTSNDQVGYIQYPVNTNVKANNLYDLAVPRETHDLKNDNQLPACHVDKEQTFEISAHPSENIANRDYRYYYANQQSSHDRNLPFVPNQTRMQNHQQSEEKSGKDHSSILHSKNVNCVLSNSGNVGGSGSYDDKHSTATHSLSKVIAHSSKHGGGLYLPNTINVSSFLFAEQLDEIKGIPSFDRQSLVLKSSNQNPLGINQLNENQLPAGLADTTINFNNCATNQISQLEHENSSPNHMTSQILKRKLETANGIHNIKKSKEVGLCNGGDSHQVSRASSSRENLIGRGSSKKTQYNEKWAIKVFKDWLEKHENNKQLETLSPEQLNEILCRFWAQVRATNREYYSRNSYLNIRAMINKHLGKCQPEHNFDIVTDQRFKSSNEMLETRLQKLKDMGKQIVHKLSISAEDLAKMYDSQTLSTNNATSLLQKVWFEITVCFCHKGSEAPEKLKKTTFDIFLDSQGRRYVGRVVEKSDIDKIKMYETKGCRCPVKSFELYCSKLHKEQSRLFQQTRKKCTDNNPVWYGKAPIGEKALQQMMGKISGQADLSHRYTNHCARTASFEQLMTFLNASEEHNHLPTLTNKYYFKAPSRDTNLQVCSKYYNQSPGLMYQGTTNIDGNVVIPYHCDISKHGRNASSVSANDEQFHDQDINRTVLMNTSKQHSDTLHSKHSAVAQGFDLTSSNNGLQIPFYGHDPRKQVFSLPQNYAVESPLYYSHQSYMASNQSAESPTLEAFLADGRQFSHNFAPNSLEGCPLEFAPLDNQQQQMCRMYGNIQQFDCANQKKHSKDSESGSLVMLSSVDSNAAGGSQQVGGPYNFNSDANSFENKDSLNVSTVRSLFASDTSISKRLQPINNTCQ